MGTRRPPERMARSLERRDQFAQKVFDTADVVKDAMCQQLTVLAEVSSLSNTLVRLFIVENAPVQSPNKCLSSSIFRATRKAENFATIKVKVHYRYLPKVEVFNKS
jgi:hypothetical protein